MDIANFGVKFDTSDVKRGSDEGVASFERLSKAAEGLHGTMESLRKVAELLGVGLGIREVVKLAAESQELTNKMRTLTDSSAGVAAIHEKLFRLAQETSTAFATEVDVFKRLYDASKTLGYSQEELLTMTKAINEATELSGGSTEAASASVMALARAFQTGAVDGRVLMTMLNQAPRLAEALAEGLGMTVEQLKSYGIGGEKAARQLGDALLSQSAKIFAEAEGQADTINKATTRIQNAFAEVIGKADGAAGALASLLSVAAEHMEGLMTLAGLVAAVWVGKMMTTMIASTINFITQLGLMGLAEAAVAVEAEAAAVSVRSLAVAQTEAAAASTAAAAATTASSGAAFAVGLATVATVAGAVVAIGALAYGLYKLAEDHDHLADAQKALGDEMKESAANVQAYRTKIDGLSTSARVAAEEVESMADRIAKAQQKIREAIKSERGFSAGNAEGETNDPSQRNQTLSQVNELSEALAGGRISVAQYSDAMAGLAKATPELRTFIGELGATAIATENARRGTAGLNAEGEKSRSWLDALKPEAARSWKDWGQSVEESRGALAAFNAGGEEGLALFQRQQQANDAGEKMWRTYAQTLGDVAIAHLTLKEAQDLTVEKTNEQKEAIAAIVARIAEQVKGTNDLASAQKGAAQAEAAKQSIRSNDSATTVLKEQIRVTKDLTLSDQERSRAIEDVSQREARANDLAEATTKKYGSRTAAVRASINAHHDQAVALTTVQRAQEDANKAHEDEVATLDRNNQILVLLAQLRGGDAAATKVQTDATNVATLAALDYAHANGKIADALYETERAQVVRIQQLQGEIAAEREAGEAYDRSATTRDLQNRATVSGLQAKGQWVEATKEEFRLSQSAAKADFEQTLARQKLTKAEEDARRAAFDLNQQNEEAIEVQRRLADSANDVSRAFQAMWDDLGRIQEEGLHGLLSDLTKSLAGMGVGSLGDIIGKALAGTMEQFKKGVKEGVGGLSGMFRDDKGNVTGTGKAIGAAGGAVVGFGAGYESGSALGGTLTGAAAGFAVGGPLGALAGGIAGFVGGLFGHAAKMKQAAEDMKKATEAFALSLAAYVGEATGTATDLSRAMLSNSATVAKLKEEALSVYHLAVEAGANSGAARDAERRKMQAAYREIEEASAKYIKKLEEEAALKSKRLSEDLDLRLSETKLSNGGRDGPGPTDPYALEDRKLKLSQEREFSDAVKALWTDEQLATLTLIQQEEWLSLARKRTAEADAVAAQKAEDLAAAMKQGDDVRLSMAEREAVLSGDIDGILKARTATIMASYAKEYEALKVIADAGGLTSEELAHFAEILSGEAKNAVADFTASLGADLVTSLDGGTISIAQFIEQMDILASNASQFRQQADVFGTSLSDQVKQFGDLYGFSGKSEDEIKSLYTQVTPGVRLTDTEAALNNAIAGYFDLSRRAADEAERARLAAEQEATASAGRTLGRTTPTGTVYTGPVTVQIMVSVKPEDFRDADRTAEMITERVDRLLAGKATVAKRASGNAVL